MQLVLRIEAIDPALAETFPGTGTVATDRTLTIGRASDNGLVLIDRDRTISKHHCVIAPTPDGYRLTDKSRNGTFLNRDPQALTRHAPAKIKAGDVMTVSCFTLTVVAAGEPPVLAQHAEPPPTVAPSRQEGRATDTVRPLPSADEGFWENHAGLTAPEPHGRDPGGYDFDADDCGRRDTGDYDGAGPKPLRRGATAFLASSHRTPAEAMAFVQPKPCREPIPADWDLAAELGRKSPPQAPTALAPEPAEIAEPPQPASIPRPYTGDAAAAAAIGAFLDATRLTGAEAAAVGLTTLFERAGTSLRVTAACLHDMLSARASAKHGFGVEQTLAEVSGNNLLKVVGDGDEALRALLLTQMPGFLVGSEMIDKAFDDLQRHQIAMLKALRAALATVCRKLAPPAIEDAVGALRWWERAVPTQRAQRCWTQYKAVFDEVAADLDNDAARIFGNGFLRAYQDTAEDASAREKPDVV